MGAAPTRAADRDGGHRSGVPTRRFVGFGVDLVVPAQSVGELLMASQEGTIDDGDAHVAPRDPAGVQAAHLPARIAAALGWGKHRLIHRRVAHHVGQFRGQRTDAGAVHPGYESPDCEGHACQCGESQGSPQRNRSSLANVPFAVDSSRPRSPVSNEGRTSARQERGPATAATRSTTGPPRSLSKRRILTRLPFLVPTRCRPNTGDKTLRSGARVQPGLSGHEAPPSSELRCRRKLRQLHRWTAASLLGSRRLAAPCIAHSDRVRHPDLVWDRTGHSVRNACRYHDRNAARTHELVSEDKARTVDYSRIGRAACFVDGLDTAGRQRYLSEPSVPASTREHPCPARSCDARPAGPGNVAERPEYRDP